MSSNSIKQHRVPAWPAGHPMEFQHGLLVVQESITLISVLLNHTRLSSSQLPCAASNKCVERRPSLSSTSRLQFRSGRHPYSPKCISNVVGSRTTICKLIIFAKPNIHMRGLEELYEMTRGPPAAPMNENRPGFVRYRHAAWLHSTRALAVEGRLHSST